MGMGPFLPFVSWVWLSMSWTKLRFKWAGLEPKLIKLDDGATTMHCWVPKEGDSGSAKDERPALVLIQGFAGSGIFGWSRQAPALAKRFRVYVPDLVFFGDSITTDSQRSEYFQADCIKKMLDVLKVDRVHVVGTSYGGIVGYYMAHRYPKLVDKVAVCSSGVMMVPTTNDRLLKVAKVGNIKDLLVANDLLHFRKTMSFATVWRVWLIPNFVLQDLYDWFGKSNMQQKRELIDGMITGSRDAPPVPVLTQDSVLILWGTKDQIFEPHLAEQLKQHLGDRAELVYFQGCGHVPQVERRGKFNAQILKFLTS